MLSPLPNFINQNIKKCEDVGINYNGLNYSEFYKVNKECGELGEGAESVVMKCTRLKKDNQ